MKRICLIVISLMFWGAFAFSQQKIDRMDGNRWNWLVGSDKYKSVEFEDGYLVLTATKANKKLTDYQNEAKTFARLPLRAKDDFKLTIKCVVADYNNSEYVICFNTDKKCMDDEEEEGDFGSYKLCMEGPEYKLMLNRDFERSEKLPGRVKNGRDYPMSFTIEKKRDTAEIEINGIQIFKGECEITTPFIGFLVPVGHSLKIDEIIIDQAENND